MKERKHQTPKLHLYCTNLQKISVHLGLPQSLEGENIFKDQLVKVQLQSIQNLQEHRACAPSYGLVIEQISSVNFANRQALEERGTTNCTYHNIMVKRDNIDHMKAKLIKNIAAIHNSGRT